MGCLFDLHETFAQTLWGLLRFKAPDKDNAMAQVGCVIAMLILAALAVGAYIACDQGWIGSCKGR